MKIEPAASPASARLIPSDAGSELLFHGLAPDELAACLGQGRRPRPWNVPRQIQVGLPGDDIQNEPGTPSIEHELEDGRVLIESGAPARVNVSDAHAAPEFPMPKSLMLGISQQWARRGRISLHAAAIELHRRRLLVIGESGAGKSTLALSALAMGGRLVSDDWLLLRLEDQALHCTPLRDRMLLRTGPASATLLERIPESPLLEPAHLEKQWMDYRALGRGLPEITCEALLYLVPAQPRPTSTRLTSVPVAEMYAALLNSTSALLFSNRLRAESEHLHQLALNLVRLPNRKATCGTDLLDEPKRVWERVIDELF
ncbi:hypothetical protein HFP89_00300 [Wenzhouxiangella sp. XN79A]|uniref:hypothetical protein n=1 Tax=Wenzhouxiangella sp. XN79A TaxID=2724193 RepID=UPI00144A7A5B|nr:hypothetical protein [Wenzhouxiangella sp. XN79A]NKI33603.1 hypothetical protein [Wenzhouxiangella sp. XN79A]